MGRWLRFGNALEGIANALAAFLTAIMAVVVFWQVLARYLLNTGQFWAEEFAVICMFWLALVGAAGALWSGDHIGLRLIVDRLPESWQGAVRAANELLIGVFAVLLFFQGVQLVARTSGGNWSALRVPLGYTYIIVPISAALMAVLSLLKGTLRAISLLGRGETPPSWSVDGEER